jgi:hypothetical protein
MRVKSLNFTDGSLTDLRMRAKSSISAVAILPTVSGADHIWRTLRLGAFRRPHNSQGSLVPQHTVQSSCTPQ